MFADLGIDGYMSVEDAGHWDQRPFRSMLIQKWIAYRPGRGFHLTPKGKDAMKEFQSTDIARKNYNAPLTAFFDATAYGLPDPRKKVHVMTKRGAA